MALSILQHTQGITSVPLVFPGACTAGSTLCAAFRLGGATDVLTSVADGTNGTWPSTNRIFQVQASDGHGLYFIDFEGNTGNTALTVTPTLSGAPSIRWAIFEIGGVPNPSIDGTPLSTFQNATTAPATPNYATNNANALILAICTTANGSAFTENASGSNPASGWASVEDVQTGRLHVSSQIFSSTGTYNETWTITSNDVATAIVAYKAAGAGVGDTLQGSQQIFFI